MLVFYYMKKIYLGLILSLSATGFCQAQQNNDTMKAAKKMIRERQSQSDRILELKLKKQNLVLKSFTIPEAETDKSPLPQNSGKKK